MRAQLRHTRKCHRAEDVAACPVFFINFIFFGEWYLCISVSDDGKCIIAAESGDLLYWNVEERKVLFQVPFNRLSFLIKVDEDAKWKTRECIPVLNFQILHTALDLQFKNLLYLVFLSFDTQSCSCSRLYLILKAFTRRRQIIIHHSSSIWATKLPTMSHQIPSNEPPISLPWAVKFKSKSRPNSHQCANKLPSWSHHIPTMEPSHTCHMEPPHTVKSGNVGNGV